MVNIHPTRLYCRHSKKSQTNVVCGGTKYSCLKDFDETKRIRHRLWCGDDAYALGRGVIKPQAMLGAKAARGHGDTGVFLTYHS